MLGTWKTPSPKPAAPRASTTAARGGAALARAYRQGPAERGERYRDARVEDRPPAERVDQNAREHGPGREAETDCRVEEAQPATAEGRGSAQRRERGRRAVDEPPGDPLHRAPGEEEREARRGAAEGEAGDGERKAHPEHGRVTDAVRRRAGDERHDRIAAGVADDDPAHPLGRGAEGGGDRRERDVDHRVERDDEGARGRDPANHAPRMMPRLAVPAGSEVLVGVMDLSPGAGTVGTLVEMKHLTATPVGMRVRARATLLGTEGRA